MRSRSKIKKDVRGPWGAEAGRLCFGARSGFVRDASFYLLFEGAAGIFCALWEFCLVLVVT